MGSDNSIQFIANYEGWVSIKKLKIEPNMDPKMIMEFLASLNTGIDGKVEANLRKLVALDKLDAAIEEEVGNGRSEKEVAKTLSAVSGRKISQVIKEIASNDKWQKNEQKEMQAFCKAYAMRKALSKLGLMVDYSKIEIPGMKRLMKKKA